MALRHEDVIIGRNTGRDEFPSHVRTLGKFGKLADFIVVLDGDSREMENRLKAVAEEYGHSLQPLFLPGEVPRSSGCGTRYAIDLTITPLNLA